MTTSDISPLWKEIAARGVRAFVEDVSDEQSIALSSQYGTHNYHPLPVNIVRAAGALVYDGSGTCFIDCIGAYSALAHGHLSEFMRRTVREQLDKLTLVSGALHCSELAVFLEALCLYTGADRACPMNSGVEAVETCLKIARK